MKQHKVFTQRLHPPQVVKVGFCWPAFFFNVAWMLYNRLWPQATLWVAALLGCRYLHAVLEASPAAAGRVPMAVALAAAYGALFLVPGLRGNRWREQSLLDDGYELVAASEVEMRPTAAAPLAG